MKSVFFALALFCSGPENRCVLVEGAQSPHETAEACGVELKRELDSIKIEDIETLLAQGGYFSAGCFKSDEGTRVSEHVDAFAERLGKPAKFYKPKLPQIDG